MKIFYRVYFLLFAGLLVVLINLWYRNFHFIHTDKQGVKVKKGNESKETGHLILRTTPGPSLTKEGSCKKKSSPPILGVVGGW